MECPLCNGKGQLTEAEMPVCGCCSKNHGNPSHVIIYCDKCWGLVMMAKQQAEKMFGRR